jgi:SsrA-binding protein
MIMDSLIYNKKINLDYEVLEKMDAGIELEGLEVKSLRKKQGNLQGAHITLRGGEAFLIAGYIPPYQEKNAPKGYDPYRNRKLLLTKAELMILTAIERQKGLTIVPISIYNKRRKIKVQIGVVRGKKKYDKRQDLKKRAAMRDLRDGGQRGL